MPETEVRTRDRLLDTAERLFSEQGIDATSLRALTREAGCNLAAVHYHFGSKQRLVEEVFARRLLPVNADRMLRLRELEEAAGSGPVPLERILEAFVLPSLEIPRQPGGGGERFIRLMGRIYTEPSEHMARFLHGQFQEVLEQYLHALRRALPSVSSVELLWRLHFLVGAMVHTVADPAKIDRMTNGACDPSDVPGVCARLVAFASAGFRAAVPEGGPT